MIRSQRQSRRNLILAPVGPLLVLLGACAPAGEPLGPDLVCSEIQATAGPTLRCEAPTAGVVLSVPWQGQFVRIVSTPVTSYASRLVAGDFTPFSSEPLVALSVRTVAGDVPVVQFDPPARLDVAYREQDFAAATPTVGDGELGVALWDEEVDDWVVVGHGVFHEGFWVADPAGGDNVVLVGDPAAGQARYVMTGDASGGVATALLAEVPGPVRPVLGALPFDPDHMLVEFDAGCEAVAVDGLDGVECVSDEAGVRVFVPLQEGGTVTPQLIALPWPKASTISDGGAPMPMQAAQPHRRAMNFLVVDADDPARVLFEFDPPMELEIAFTFDDRDPQLADQLQVQYWDEYLEQLVVLGEGDTGACGGGVNPGCLWGEPVEAIGHPDLDGLFFQESEEGGAGGIAKFLYDRWGDRLVLFGR